MKYKASELVGKNAKVYVGLFFKGQLLIDGIRYACMVKHADGLIVAYRQKNSSAGVPVEPDNIVEVVTAR